MTEEKVILKKCYHSIMIDLNKQLTSEFVMLRPKITDGIKLFNGDIDFAVDQNAFSKFLKIIHYHCKICGVHFELNQKPLNKKVIHLFILNSRDCITLEIWCNIEISDRRRTIISANKIFTSNIFRTCKNAVLACLYITHLYHKNKEIITEENKFRYHWFINNIISNHHFEKKTIDLLINTFNSNLSLLEANLKALELLKKEGIQPAWSKINLIRELTIRLVKKLKLKTKNVIPIIGPDGVGKGTLKDMALKKLNDEYVPFPFKLLFRIKLFYRLRLSFFKNWKESPNNQLDEEMSNYIFWSAFISFPFLILLKKPKKVLLDRFYMDYFASPLRYYTEIDLPKKITFYQYYKFLTPTPVFLVLLGCKDSTLSHRKDELGIAALRILEDVYLDFISSKKIPYMLFISTERDAESTSNVLYEKLITIEH